MHKLVIVDDSQIILAMARDILEKSGQIEAEIETISNGEAAIERLRRMDVDVVILDVVMPGINGVDILKFMGENDIFESTKAIMFTSLNDKSFMKECFEGGASDYIHKPLEPNEFIARIKSALAEQDLRKELISTIGIMKNQNEELVALYKELTETQSKLLQREQLMGLGRLAAGIAHEINTPLGYVSSNVVTLKSYINAIKKYMDELLRTSAVEPITHDNVMTLLKKHDVEQATGDFTNIYFDIIDGIKRISFIVNSLRTFSRIDSYDEFEEYNINEALEQIIILTKMESLDIAIVETDFREVPLVSAKGGELNQALLNVVKNAIDAIREKAGPSRGHITIRTESVEDGVKCTVHDTGTGIDHDIRKDIFTPFFTTKSVGSGMGLGLSITYDIVVNKHGGSIDVESSVEGGTTVTIILPITVKDDKTQ